jgi:hypothetical protein
MDATTPAIKSTYPAVEHCHALASSRDSWTPDARTAYQQVLGELDRWSRRHDASSSLNSWIAEEVVRRVW